jgi:transcription elongation factor Elf1
MKTEEQKQMLRDRRMLIQKTLEDAAKKLFPCPFCGDTPILNSRRRSNQPEYNIECDCLTIAYITIETISKRLGSETLILPLSYGTKERTPSK